jgi:hypothetical protein
MTIKIPGRIRLLFLVPFLFLATLKTHRTYSGDGDEPHYLLMAESLYDDGDLRLENQYPDKHAFMPHYTEVGAAVQTPSGSMYPIHDIGLSVLMLPLLSVVHAVVPLIPESFLALTKMNLPMVTSTVFAYQSMVVTGFVAILCFFLFRDHGFSETESFWFSLWAILTPPLVTLGYLYFTEIYSCFIVVGMVLLLRRKMDLIRTCLYALGVFLLSWLHIKNSVMAMVLSLLWLRQRYSAERSPVRVISWILPGLALALAELLRAVLHHHYFGRPSLLIAWGSNPLSLRMLPTGLFGLIFDRECGLLFANPVFFLLPAGLLFCWRAKRSWWSMEGIIAFSYLAGLPFFWGWHGAWSPAARYWVPVIPLLWIPVAGVVQRLWNGETLERWVVRGLILIGGVISACHWQFPRYFWNQGNGVNRWMDLLSFFGIQWQRALPSFFVQESTRVLSVGVTLFLLACFNIWLNQRTSSRS